VPDGAPLPDGTQPRKVIIDENVAPKLILVWRLATQNKSIRTIARELDRIGLKTVARSKHFRNLKKSFLLRRREME
jgi:hypothetical protein